MPPPQERGPRPGPRARKVEGFYILFRLCLLACFAYFNFMRELPPFFLGGGLLFIFQRKGGIRRKKSVPPNIATQAKGLITTGNKQHHKPSKPTEIRSLNPCPNPPGRWSLYPLFCNSPVIITFLWGASFKEHPRRPQRGD